MTADAGSVRHVTLTFSCKRGASAILFATIIAIIGACEARAADGVDNRPNVVLFVADDHGQDAGVYGNTDVRTPSIDRLARDGTLYRYAFCTTASCSPSRSVLLSGLHNHANGQVGLAHSYHHFASFRSVQSLPVILSKHGYRTGRVGKFHVAPEEVFRFDTALPNAGGNRNAVRMAENSREFLADKTTPFFLYFCTSDPHRGGGRRVEKPGQPDAFGNNTKYPGVREIEYDPDTISVPSWLPDTRASRAELAEYYQAVSRLDQGLGRLLDLLKETGQYDNTLIIYTSDNGIAMPGAKTTLYEPGLRLPLIVRRPHQERTGVVSEAMISWVDITPTILDFAGITEVMAPPLRQADPESNRTGRDSGEPLEQYRFHGRSFRGTLETERPEGWDTIYASHTFHEITMYYPMRLVRTNRYKLILNLAHPLPFPFASDLEESATWKGVINEGRERYGKRLIKDYIHRPRYELYDLERDPDEIQNLADDPAHSTVFEVLAAKLREFQKQTQDPWILKYDYE